MSPLLPRKVSVQQGTTAAPVKTPAEDWRLNDGGLWTPGSAQFQERSGVVAGAGPSAGVEPLAVTAAAGGVFTIQPGRFYVQGSAALQGGYLGTVDQVTTRTIAGVDLPASGSFKAGYLGIKVYDQVYSDTQDGSDIIYTLGASAASSAGATYPTLPTNFLQLRAFTVDATGAVTFGAYLPPFTVPRGGIPPVRSTDVVAGSYNDQYRSHPTYGLQRWDGTRWKPVGVGEYGTWRGGTHYNNLDATSLAVAATPPKIFTAVLDAAFGGVSYAVVGCGYPSGFFTEVPVVTADFALENSYAVYGGTDQHTTTGCIVVVRSGANIAGTLTAAVHLTAIGR